MKFFALFAILLAVFVTAQAAFCPCNLRENNGPVCGSNGITYKTRCEFECTQREYKSLGKNINVVKPGPCNPTPNF